MSEEQHDTDNTDDTVVLDTPLADRLDSILDALATSNRAARVHAEELRWLTVTVLVALGFMAGMCYITYYKGAS